MAMSASSGYASNEPYAACTPCFKVCSVHDKCKSGTDKSAEEREREEPVQNLTSPPPPSEGPNSQVEH